MKKQTENERKKEKWSKRKCGKVNEKKKNIYDQVFKEANTHTHTLTDKHTTSHKSGKIIT